MRSNFIILQLVLALTLLITGIAQAQHTLHYAQSPDQTAPWGEEQIMASRMMDAGYVATDAPIWNADPMNITLVVEADDHHVSVLDGDTFKVLDRFAAPIGAHTYPKFSPDGRYVFILSHDGWVQKYDIWSQHQVGRVRAGLNSRNIAISADGKWLAVASTLPNTLTILATKDLSLAKVIKVTGGDGAPSRLSGVYNNPPRESFILALMDAPKIWEVFYGPNPPAMGFAHDWRIEGPVPQSTPFPIRKITTPDFLDNFIFDPSYEYILGAARQGGGMVIDLVIGQKVAELDVFGGGFGWKRGDKDVMAIPHHKKAVVSVVDMKTWETVARITTDGPGLFASSHENSKYIWVDVSFGANRGGVQIIDKQTLETVKTLRPTSGASVAHVGFTKTGSHVLVSVRHDGGAVIVYDAETLKEVTRLQMRNPSGSYNVTHCMRLCSGALGITP